MGFAFFFFVFCIFEILDSYFFRIFFCILYFRDFGFVFFLYFVFLRFWIRIFFVFFSYFFRIFFVKIQKKIQNKYKKNTKKIHLVLLYFFCIFLLRPKIHFVFLYFFVFSHSFSDCSLSFCTLDISSKNNTASPPTYVVFPLF